MKNSNLKATIGLAACFLAVPALQASTTINTRGCLARGERPHEYTVTDVNGERYGLVSEPGTGVNIRKHVGQEVMVTGTVAKAARERREAAKTGTAADDQYLQVNQVKKVSASCQ